MRFRSIEDGSWIHTSKELLVDDVTNNLIWAGEIGIDEDIDIYVNQNTDAIEVIGEYGMWELDYEA
jgi:hypothetical protein